MNRRQFIAGAAAVALNVKLPAGFDRPVERVRYLVPPADRLIRGLPNPNATLERLRRIARRRGTPTGEVAMI
jgi:hypothetical protein